VHRTEEDAAVFRWLVQHDATPNMKSTIGYTKEKNYEGQCQVSLPEADQGCAKTMREDKKGVRHLADLFATQADVAFRIRNIIPRKANRATLPRLLTSLFGSFSLPGKLPGHAKRGAELIYYAGLSSKANLAQHLCQWVFPLWPLRPPQSESGCAVAHKAVKGARGGVYIVGCI